MTEAFQEALQNFKPKERYTSEYRVYYNKETGEVLSSIVTKHNIDPPQGDYIVITSKQYPPRHLAQVKDQKLVYPTPDSRAYNLAPSDSGYGTIKNNPYIIGTEQFYEYKQQYK